MKVGEQDTMKNKSATTNLQQLNAAALDNRAQIYVISKDFSKPWIDFTIEFCLWRFISLALTKILFYISGLIQPNDHVMCSIIQNTFYLWCYTKLLSRAPAICYLHKLHPQETRSEISDICRPYQNCPQILEMFLWQVILFVFPKYKQKLFSHESM